MEGARGRPVRIAGARPPSSFSFTESNFRFLALDDDAPGFTWRTFRYPRDLPRLATMSEILSPLDADLTPFSDAGGKLIVDHGWADPGISALGTLDYIERMTRFAGGQAAADQFTRPISCRACTTAPAAPAWIGSTC